MEKEKIEQMERTILSAMIDGKTFEFDLATPEQEQCFEILTTAKILIEVPPKMPDPKTQGIVVRPQGGVKVKARKSALVRVASDWQEKWKKWKDDHSGTYGVHGEQEAAHE